jgi:hypothetical protein
MLGDLVKHHEWSMNSRVSLRVKNKLARYVDNYWINEQEFQDDVLDALNPKVKYLDGYFQNYRYANAIRDSLLDRFRESETFQTLLPNELINRVVVHMRFGDYLSSPETMRFHGLTDVSYYANAAKLLLEELKCSEVVIVSDDPPRALEELSKEMNSKEINLYCADVDGEVESLSTISHSAGIVISNSSFSWWAAWIASTLKGAEVIAPTPWLARLSKADDSLAVPSWRFFERLLAEP